MSSVMGGGTDLIGGEPGGELARARSWLLSREEELHPSAARERTSSGRAMPEPPDALRLEFQVDRDRIIHSLAFRRLKHKTQVFVAPDSDHVVTRMTHTLEVQQVARTIARALRLNEDLAEAIALAHDLGHTPFGHAGEEALAELLPDGFRHNEQSLRIVDTLERDGRGLNLMPETRDGILKHSKSRESVAAEAWGTAATLEGQIVKLADSIAYLNHDFDDALRAAVLEPGDLPSEVRAVLGEDRSTRIGTLVRDCVERSAATLERSPSQGGPRIALSPQVLRATDAFRDFMFERVYLRESTLVDARRGQAVVRALFEHFAREPGAIPGWSLPNDPPWRRAADYVSGMTDGYATRMASILGLLGRLAR